MRTSFKILTAGLALAGTLAVQPAPALARPYPYLGPHYGGGFGYRPAGFAPRPYYAPRYYGGFRPAYYGPRRYYGYPYGYYRHRSYNGGALAAGLIGGLALGTIASAAANPYPYGYGPAYYRPAYYGPVRRCVTERRRFVNPYGRVVFQRIETCY